MVHDSNELFIFAGEISADLHGEKLINALLRRSPDLKIFGVGGPKMRAAGMECLLPMEAFQVMGFLDVFFALPKLLSNFFFLRKAILQRNPPAAVFIDYAEFNMRLEASLRKKGYRGKLIHYISPSVWAWRKGRIQLMSRALDLLLVIFPFERAFFEKTSLKTVYVGHPLIERLRSHRYREGLFPTHKQLIALFPGSRKKEILRNFPIMLRTVKRLHRPGLLFAVSLSHPKFKSLLEEMIRKENLENETCLVNAEETYDLMKTATLAIAKSGTVTLELALHAVPTIVIYKISRIDLFIARDLCRIRLPYYSIVNIIAQKEVFPEFFGPHLKEEGLYQTALDFLSSPSLREKVRSECTRLCELLESKNASDEAAQSILSLI